MVLPAQNRKKSPAQRTMTCPISLNNFNVVDNRLLKPNEAIMTPDGKQVYQRQALTEHLKKHSWWPHTGRRRAGGVMVDNATRKELGVGPVRNSNSNSNMSNQLSHFETNTNSNTNNTLQNMLRLPHGRRRWRYRSSNGMVYTAHEAAFDGRFSIVRRLVQQGVDVNKRDSRGDTILHQVAQGDDGDTTEAEYDGIVDFLLQKGATVDALNTDGRTPLYEAVVHGKKSVVRKLLANGANPNLKPQGEQSMLRSATGGIVLYSQNEGGNPYNNTHYYRVHQDYQDIVKQLIAKGANVNVLHHEIIHSRDPENGATLLHIAARVGSLKWVKFLAKGALINAVDKGGWTPLHYASRYSWQKVRWPDRRNTDRYAHIARYLIQQGARWNTRTLNGKTARNLSSSHPYIQGQNPTMLAVFNKVSILKNLVAMKIARKKQQLLNQRISRKRRR